MGPYQHLMYRIPRSSHDPEKHRAFIAELEKLPQYDPEVRAILQEARIALAEAEETARRWAAYKAAGITQPHIVFPPHSDNAQAYYLIEPGPDRFDPLEKHRAFIASLEELPQGNPEVQSALQRAREMMAMAEQENREKQKKAADR
jgi:hypothetical protein